MLPLAMLAAAPIAVGLLLSAGVLPYAPLVDGRCTPEVRDRIPLGGGEVTTLVKVCTNTRTDAGARWLDARTEARLVATEAVSRDALPSLAAVVRLRNPDGSELTRSCSWDESARDGGWQVLTTTCRVSTVAVKGSYQAVGYLRWATAAGVSGTTRTDEGDRGDGDGRAPSAGDPVPTGSRTGAGSLTSTRAGAGTRPSAAPASTPASTPARTSGSSSAVAPGTAPSTPPGRTSPTAPPASSPGVPGAGGPRESDAVMSGAPGAPGAPPAASTAPPVGSDPAAATNAVGTSAKVGNPGTLDPWLGAAALAGLAAGSAHRVLRKRVPVGGIGARSQDEDPTIEG